MQKIAYNEGMKRVGQSHPKTTLTDHEVEMVRQLHESGESYKCLADKFDTPLRTIKAICRFERRTAIATNWKVHITP